MKTTIEKLEFPSDIKIKVKKLVNTSKITIDFIGGTDIKLCNTNIGIVEPHKIIFSNNTSSLVVLVYENEEKFIAPFEGTPITLSKLAHIINEYM